MQIHKACSTYATNLEGKIDVPDGDGNGDRGSTAALLVAISIFMMAKISC